MGEAPINNRTGKFNAKVSIALIGFLLVSPASAQRAWNEVRDVLEEGGPCPKQLAGSAPTYPSASIRNREEGRVVVGLCVDAQGKPSSFEVLLKSGAPRLDIATTLWSCGRTFFPELDSRGMPRATCAAVSEFTWKLKDFPETHRFLADDFGPPIYVERTASDQSNE